MTELYIYDRKIESVFQLLGQKENDISYSVGYSLSNCRQFLSEFLRHLGIKTKFEPEKIKIRLQVHESDKGFTDFEIIKEGEFHIIIEAKRGWIFPTKKQLEKYVTRTSFIKSTAKYKRIIVFNESTPEFTKSHFDIHSIKGVRLQVISWKTIQELAQNSKRTGRDSDNKTIKELTTYLDQVITMQKVDSNLVYVVSLGSGTNDSWKIGWQDIVNKKRKYFHPVGGGKGGWPSEPPNYIAFRYNGKLQSIHHIDSYEVFTNPNKVFKEIPKRNWDLHYLYHLGPAIIPTQEIKAGKKIVRSMRVWAMLDLLLTSRTIQEARDKTKERLN